MLTGTCLCRGVRYEIDGKLGPIVHCHCNTCRKAQGGGFVTNAPVRTKYFRVLSGADLVTEFDSSPGKKRCFCRTCGSPLWSRRESDPETVRIRLGLLESDPERRPAAHVWVSEKVGWDEISDSLPQSPGGGEELEAQAKTGAPAAVGMMTNKALWEKGDFTRIAESMRESGEALVKTLGITRGLKVLDLGCGDGTTAIPEARLGADVLGVDIAQNLVEAGNRRAREQGLTNCKFQEGDASDLHELDDHTFDLVVSIFGAMFAPKPFDVAKEMVRVTRPGGRIIMGNWIPGDPTLVAQILKISSAYSPPPPEGFISPMTWGIESNVIERFAGAGVPDEKISFARNTYSFTFPGTPSELLAAFRKYYGPTMNAFEAADKNGRVADLQKELEALFNSHNESPSKDATCIPATFLRVTVVV